MSSEQEVEEFTEILNGHYADNEKDVVKNAKRLLFEVFRFANGKTFRRASAANEPAFILFKNYPDRIVIDCNHDDFAMADIQAFCQPCVEDQVKATSFRSILSATKKLHIQSGNVSLEFESQPRTTLTDALKPVWFMPTENLPDNLSRITLYIYDQGSEKKLGNVVTSQFENLKEPCILFLRDLVSMTVEFCDRDGKVNRSKTFRKSYVDAYRVSVKTITIGEGLEKSHIQLYHVTKQPPADQPTNVMLAFPLSDKFEIRADTDACGLFNFVQLRGSPLRFHIHSDLDIDDKRGPIPVSTHNLAIKDSISSVFFQAILQFCKHPTLRYHWPSFLLSKEECLNPFWVSLEDDMRNWIAQNPVLISRNNKHWRHISHLTILSADARDVAGNPLLDDRINDPFLSNNYPPDVIRRLESYGLASLDSDRLFEMLEVHFNNPWVGRHRMFRTDWHNALDRLISKTFIDKKEIEKIKSLPLLELKNGDLVAAASEPLYFPKTEDVYIPESLGLRVVNDAAIQEQYSRALYEELGVLQVTVSYVRDSILDKLSSSNDLSLGEIKSYLRYFYLTHRFCTPELNQLKVMTIGMQIIEPSNTVVYMPGMDDPYGPEKLLGSDFASRNGQIHFLHRDILDDAPEAPRVFHPSWKDWLRDCLGVRERLSVLRPRPFIKPQSSREIIDFGEADVLSEEFRFVFEKLPESSLGLIQYLWAYDGPQVMKSPSLVADIQGLPVPTICTRDSPLRLHDTWVPLRVLRESVQHYMESPDGFPFLDLGKEKSMDMAIYTKWNFLVKDLGVKRQNDMVFLLDILNSIKLSCHELSSWQTDKVFELYTAINTRLQLAIPGERERVLDFLEDSGVLYIDETGPIWKGLSGCGWNAPANLITTYSLETFLKEKNNEQEQMGSLSELFRVGMSVTDVSAKELVEELLVLRNEGCEDVAHVTEIYKYLDESLSTTDEIRTAFEECAVILIEKDGRSIWVTTSQCFWSEADTTPLNSSLRGCYPDLESFFVQKLGTKVSAYDKLLDLSTDTEDHSMIQDLLLSLMGETKGSLNEFPLEPLRKAKIFAVTSPWKYDQPSIPKLCSVDTDFAIGDRPQLQVLLELSIKMLVYDLATVRRLQPLFKLLSMEDRYLSRCVEERFQDVSPFPIARWKLGDKAYQIARVGATFDIYGSSDDSFSLYKQLVELEIVEVDWISTSLAVFQDGQTIKSQMTHQPAAWVSDSHSGLTIYVRRDTRSPEWNPASALPKTLQQWLMRSTCQSSGINGLEVLEVLSSIFTVSGSHLDKILWEQGIVKVPFENIELNLKKAMIKVRLPTMDERKPCA